MTLEEHIERIRTGLTAGHFVNEAAVCTGVVQPILQALDWPIYDPHVLAPEYTVEGRRVDYALCDPPDRPKVFLEVKQVGQGTGADRQLFEYAFHHGVPMAVLTDGQEWHFYLPAEQGSYQERRAYKLDLIERDTDESARRLRRYLGYYAVRSDEAYQQARADYQSSRKKRQAVQALPEAWQQLVANEDELLVQLLVEQVESISGFSPDLEAVTDFLANRLSLVGTPVSTAEHREARPRQAQEREGAQTRTGRRRRADAQSNVENLSSGLPSTGFRLNGQFHRARSAREVMVCVFQALADRDPSFLDRFAALPRHGRNRRYLSRDRNQLYAGRPDLVDAHSVEIRPGWWMGTNYSRRQIGRIVQMACEVAGLRFGKDLAVNL